MNADELRGVFPLRIVRGALLRADGSAVGLVGGGAPQWDLLPPRERAARAHVYHQAVLALDRTLHIYTLDQPLDLDRQIGYLFECQESAGLPLHAAILGEIADRLAEAAPAGALRAKQVVWAVAATAAHGSGLPVRRRATGAQSVRGDEVLREAIESARRLADALGALGGYPPPRLLEPEETAQLLYRQADPVRGQRYRLNHALLERVQRVVPATSGE